MKVHQLFMQGRDIQSKIAINSQSTTKKIPPIDVATTLYQSFGKKKVKCFYCKKLGHLITNYNKKNNNFYVATFIAKGDNPTCYIDIKVFQHMCFDRERCTNYQPFKSNKLVFLGDNTTHDTHG